MVQPSLYLVWLALSSVSFRLTFGTTTSGSRIASSNWRPVLARIFHSPLKTPLHRYNSRSKLEDDYSSSTIPTKYNFQTSNFAEVFLRDNDNNDVQIKLQSIGTREVAKLLGPFLTLRGGDEEEEEEEEDAEYEESEDEDEQSTDISMDYADLMKQVFEVATTKVIPVVVIASKKTYVVLSKATISTYYAVQRAFRAALEGDEDEGSSSKIDDTEENEEPDITMIDQALKLATKIVKTIKRMVVAALDFPETDSGADEQEEDDDEDDDDGDDVDSTLVETMINTTARTPHQSNGIFNGEEDELLDPENEPQTTQEKTSLDDTHPESEASSADFGSFLAKAYDSRDGRSKSSDIVVMGGSFEDALKKAKSQARILLVFIPCEKPTKGPQFLFGGNDQNSDSKLKDKMAIESLLSPDVVKAANKRARKNGMDTGSYAIWGAKAGSSESKKVIKQLKIQSTFKGEKRPILCAVYPALVSTPDSGRLPRIVPQLLSQHHCNPPPDSKAMASWMRTLRKRHSKHYAALQKEVKEMEIRKERTKGYVESIQSDTERKKQEEKAKAEQKAKEMAEAERLQALKDRRKELKASLPADVKSGANVKRVSLRFADGRSGQRGFSSDQPLSVLFNWVDALFELERETVILTTLNGKLTLSWDEQSVNDKTLEDAGLGKLTAFRVKLKKDDEAAPVMS